MNAHSRRLFNARKLTGLGAIAALALAALALAALAVPYRPANAQVNAADSIAMTQALTQPGIAPAPGVDRALDERVKAVASRLRCPVCQGESIQDSPAELATQMKTLVREQLAAGKTEAEVIAYFVTGYGEWIMLEPKAEGFNLLVYWLPVLFLVFGGIGIWTAVKRWTATPAPPSA